jgi:peptidyl-prolyl cis-trans isomerase SurA
MIAHTQESVSILFKIDNKIITNIDIKNESKYLLALNPQLENIGEQQRLKIAEQSIIKEMIKENELLKYYNLNQDDELLDKIIQNFYTKLGIENKELFESYLKKFDLTIADIKKKIEIETVWNQLIYDKYISQIQINEKALKEKIKLQNNNKNIKSLLLSEIVFEKNSNENFQEIVEKINKSINEVGFENTANIYSVAESSKFGGKIGWIEEQNLSAKFIKELNKIKVNQISTPISNGSFFVILKINDVKNEVIKKDLNKELKKLVLFEEERQLANFSKIYYNKLKINSLIDVQ